jgi:hypothetical protein
MTKETKSKALEKPVESSLLLTPAVSAGAEAKFKPGDKSPKETAQYETEAVNKETVGPCRAARMEIEALNRELEFYGKVRAALQKICKPYVPEIERPQPERPSSQLYQPRTTRVPQ